MQGSPECRVGRDDYSHLLPHVMHRGPLRGPEKGGELSGARRCWKTSLLGLDATFSCSVPVLGARSGHSVKARASPTTVSPSGATFPNSGSPEAASMRGWQPQGSSEPATHAS